MGPWTTPTPDPYAVSPDTLEKIQKFVPSAQDTVEGIAGAGVPGTGFIAATVDKEMLKRLSMQKAKTLLERAKKIWSSHYVESDPYNNPSLAGLERFQITNLKGDMPPQVQRIVDETKKNQKRAMVRGANLYTEGVQALQDAEAPQTAQEIASQRLEKMKKELQWEQESRARQAEIEQIQKQLNPQPGVAPAEPAQKKFLQVAAESPWTSAAVGAGGAGALGLGAQEVYRQHQRQEQQKALGPTIEALKDPETLRAFQQSLERERLMRE